MTSSHLYTTTACLVFLLTVGVIAPFSATAAPEHSQECPLEVSEPADIFNLTLSDTLTFSTFSVDTKNTASIIVTNNSDCSFPVSLGSYEVYNQNVSDQKLYDHKNKVIQPQSSQLLHVSLPNCMSQVDLLHDPNQDGPPQPPTPANPKLIGWTFQLNDKDTPEENDIFHFSADHPYNELDRFPNDDDDGYSTVPEANRCTDNPPLTLSCDVSPDNPTVNQQITWQADDVAGGSGSYFYDWNGDVTGSDKTETAVYDQPGEKTATVTIESGNQQRSAQCSIDVNSSDDDDDGSDDDDDGGDDDDDGSDDDDDGGENDGSFTLTNPGSSMWAIAHAPLRSTKTELRLSKDSEFNNQVILTASSSQITNSSTMFVHDGNNPQETVTLQPSDFSDSLYIFTTASVPAATYPVTITGESTNGMSTSTIAPLRVQSYTEF